MASANLHKRGKVYHWKAMIGGKQYRKSTGMSDLAMAKRRASEFDKAIRSGQAGWTAPAPLFVDWASRYAVGFSETEKPRIVNLLARAAALWKTRRIDSIRAEDCRAYIRYREAQLDSASSTIWLECVRLRALFGAAKEDKLIEDNPWRSIKLVQPEGRERVLTPREEAQLRAQLDGWTLRLLDVALGTGLRRNELAQLRPEWLNDGVIRVPKEHAKGRKARQVPLRGEVLTALRAQLLFEGENAATGRLEVLPEAAERCFFVYNGQTLNRVIVEGAKAAGIPRVTLHDLRRTFATRAATGELTGSSVPLLFLTKVMGHSSPTVTAKYYVHITDTELMAQMTGTQIAKAVEADVSPSGSRDSD